MYIVIEIQKTPATCTALTTSYEDENTAKQAYHTALAAAAVSSVKVHTVMMVDEFGNDIKDPESYSH